MQNNFRKRFKKMLDYETFKNRMEEAEGIFDDYYNYLDLMKEFEGK